MTRTIHFVVMSAAQQSPLRLAVVIPAIVTGVAIVFITIAILKLIDKHVEKKNSKDGR